MTRAKIRAEFVLEDGHPVTSTLGGKLRHYAVKLSVENAPEHARSVTYQLHESFYDPVREIRKRKGGFEEEIYTYGDFPVIVILRHDKGVDQLTRSVAAALRETYGNDAGPAIMRAIEDIADN